ncbi:HDR165Cp [Eremothecium sinecaudum]|uniref:Sulfiredoxin n=1 Tax=Eremothecium sinecaudum TaxID=45286 RepID=A0A0X8HT01_9SACH|nr:HDR165Cp [Eremothecium sinecaudum]AMD20907.1 HDR165Cp [Eremothecium sinecaudum]
MSLQTRNISRVQQIPLSKIRRPIAPVLDNAKIDAMVSTSKGVPAASSTCTLEEATAMNGELPPVDVMHVIHNGKEYFFAFGGCHRFQAYERLSRENNTDELVRCKVIPSTRDQMRIYVGASVDSLFDD